jgi:hypothetical protein
MEVPMTGQREPLICLDPTNRPRTLARHPAARPASLVNATIGLVSNTLGRSRELLHRVYDEVAAVAPAARPLEIVKPHKSVPPSPDDWQRLTSEATLALTGFGG